MTLALGFQAIWGAELLPGLASVPELTSVTRGAFKHTLRHCLSPPQGKLWRLAHKSRTGGTQIVSHPINLSQQRFIKGDLKRFLTQSPSWICGLESTF